ncbi:hypothetical protein VM1G_05053 [Cytospora mali]|uniref:Uncharacterized protein n=1 Tax=Cytospora mali TaxID=578113 RepID=A0A194W1B8_CYTMA|nr:hypothetical protein VM1G_05053 [Valsa mali]
MSKTVTAGRPSAFQFSGVTSMDVCLNIALVLNQTKCVLSATALDIEDEEEEEQEGQGPRLPRVQGARKSPKKVTVVRSAPSHDGTPTFAAYDVLEHTQHLDDTAQRPPFGLVIYDTTPDANPSRAERIARAVFDRTMTERRRSEGDPDRIEVVVFPLRGADQSSTTSTEPPLTDRERAEACTRHYEHERASRLAMPDPADAKSWFLPERIYDDWYAWGIIVIDRLEERWEGALNYLEDHPEEDSPIVTEDEAIRSPFGSFVKVYWQPREEVWERWGEPVTPESHVWLSRMKLERMGRGLGVEGLLQSVSGFYEHFVSEGILDRELAAARAK